LVVFWIFCRGSGAQELSLWELHYDCKDSILTGLRLKTLRLVDVLGKIGWSGGFDGITRDLGRKLDVLMEKLGLFA